MGTAAIVEGDGYRVTESIVVENRKAFVRTTVEMAESKERAVVGDRQPLRRFNVIPMGAPRMNKADRWRKRPVVVRYFDYRAQLQLAAGTWIPPAHSMWIVFLMPMPESWTIKKKTNMAHSPHQQKPDIDNLEKGFLDAFGEDKFVWDCRSSKLWVPEGEHGILIF